MPRAATIHSNDRSMQIATVPPALDAKLAQIAGKLICPAIQLFKTQLPIPMAQSNRTRIFIL